MTFTFQHGDRPLEGYTVQRGVGRGGFGEVYYAVSDSGKEVAIKYLRDNPQIELRGVSHCMNLKSPHLVTVYDIRQNAAGEYFIIMEYVSGPSLRDLLVAEGDKGLGTQKAAFFLREIAKGLGYLHDRGIVHRDLKPGNIFYEDGYVKIGDYGLSKFISVSQHSVQTASVGTVHYMAPEVGSGNYGRGVDIYALGVILYEMLLGRVPYDGSSMGEVLMKHLVAQPEVDALPAPFGEVIAKALAKDPKDRYQTVDEMTEAVFGADDIRDSVARFEPTSVSMAAARAVPVQVAAGVGGSSGEVNLPPRGAVGGTGSGGAWQAAGYRGADRAGEPCSWGDRWRQRREERRARMRGRLNEVESRFRNLEGVRPGDIPRFPPRSRWVAGILGVLLGWLGVHRFYLGYTRIGWIQLILTMVTGGTAGLWGIIEGILILGGAWTEDVYGRPLVGRREEPRVPILRERWLERLIAAVFVAAGLSAGVAVVFGGLPGSRSAQGIAAFEYTFPTTLTFVVVMTVAVLIGSVAAVRLHTALAPPFLGRLVVFGMGLLALLGASAFCDETFGPPRTLYVAEISPFYGNQADYDVLLTDQRQAKQRYAVQRAQFGRMLETLVGGLAASLLLANWTKAVGRGAEGRVELGSAVWAGVVAGVAGLFWSEDYFPLAGGIAATTSLTAQSVAFIRLRGRNDRFGGSPGTPSGPVQRQMAPSAGPYEAEERNAREEAAGPHSGPYAAAVADVTGETPGPHATATAGETPAPHAAQRTSSEQACTDRARRVWQSICGAILAVPAVAIPASALDVDDDVLPFCVAVGAAIAFSIPWITCVTRRLYRGSRVEAVAGGLSPACASEIASPDTTAQPAQAREGRPSGFILRSASGPTDSGERPLRSNAARVFWGMVAAALLCGALMCFFAMTTIRMGVDEQAGTLAGGLAMLACEVFALSKVTRRRRPGLYREWLRPLFIAICLAVAAIGASVLGGMRLGAEEMLVAIGLIVCGLVFALFFAVIRGSPSRR